MPNSTGQPNRILLMLVCLMLPLVGSTAFLQAQDQPNQGEPAKLTEPLTALQTMQLNELAALKARLGGGITEALKGVVPDTDPEQQLLDSLKRLVQEQKTTELKLVPLQKQEIRKTSDITGDAIISTPWRVQVGQNSESADSDQKVLRSTARTLEDLAAKLEQAQLYDKADELRKTAARYWLQARTMD